MKTGVLVLLLVFGIAVAAFADRHPASELFREFMGIGAKVTDIWDGVMDGLCPMPSFYLDWNNPNDDDGVAGRLARFT